MEKDVVGREREGEREREIQRYTSPSHMFDQSISSVITDLFISSSFQKGVQKSERSIFKVIKDEKFAFYLSPLQFVSSTKASKFKFDQQAFGVT